MSTNPPNHDPRSAAGAGQVQESPGYGAPAYAGGPGAYGADPLRVGTQPGKHVGFGEAVKRMYSRYAQFSGRASRSEYWWVQLFVFLVYLVVGGLTSTVGTDSSGEANAVGLVLSLVLFVFLLGSIVPLVALAVRRLHDGNFSGWLYLLVLIPFAGGLVLLVLTVLPPKAEGARFDR